MSSFSGNIFSDTATQADFERGDKAVRNAYRSSYNAKNRLCDIDEIKVKLNGVPHTIRPKYLALIIKQAVSEIEKDPYTAFLKTYFEKEVILTFSIKTACTDGIRIFMSPIWAHFLLQWGKIGRDAWKNGKSNSEWVPTAESLKRQPDEYNRIANNLQLKYLKFTLIHEAYHIFNQHIKRGAILTDDNSKRIKNRLNISADIEINRDIEGEFPEYRGISSDLHLIWWNDNDFTDDNGNKFKSEYFEEIFERLKESAVDKLSNSGSGASNPDTKEEDPDDTSRSPLHNFYDKGYNYAKDSILKGKLKPLEL